MSSATIADADVAVVRSGFEAFAKGDVATFAQMFHTDATWHHRNDDRLGGVHRGTDGITSFLAESGQLTGNAACRAAGLHGGRVGTRRRAVQVSGLRPDGRSFDVPQILLFSVDGDRVRTVDQFVGDPAAVAAFWV